MAFIIVDGGMIISVQFLRKISDVICCNLHINDDGDTVCPVQIGCMIVLLHIQGSMMNAFYG